MKGGNKPRLLLLAAAALAGLATGSQSFLRPTACAPTVYSAAVNSSSAVRSLLECALRCISASWCAAMLVGTSDCSLIDWELYFGSWFGQGADCPDGLYEKEAALEWLPFSSCQQIDETPVGSCSKAIDGNTNQQFHEDFSCTHTYDNSSNWWRASLPQRAYIDRVALYNRQDCCSERLNNFTLSLDGAVFATYYEPSFFSVRNFSCGRVGQTVQVDQHFSNALTLCEVIVYGRRLP